MAGRITWDARDYDEVADLQERLGRSVLERRAWRGDEIVLDAGCGSGRVTRLLAERVPRGRVYAVDADPDMVRHARDALASFSPRARVLQGDLLQVGLSEPVDVVFSTATFHWILDHDALFAHLLTLLKHGGELLAQCGGEGNIARALTVASCVMQEPPFRDPFAGWTPPWRFEDADSTQERLLIAGFLHPEASLEATPETFPDRGAFGRFVRTIPLNPHLARLPTEALRDEFLTRYLDRCEAELRPRWTLDYVRLNVRAKRGPDPTGAERPSRGSARKRAD